MLFKERNIQYRLRQEKKANSCKEVIIIFRKRKLLGLLMIILTTGLLLLRTLEASPPIYSVPLVLIGVLVALSFFLYWQEEFIDEG